MAKHGFRVFDSDMHIMEPPDLWQRFIASEYRSIAPVGVTSENVRDLRLHMPGDPQGSDREQRRGEVSVDVQPGC